MAHPNLHAKSSAKKFGGKPEDYIHLHEWMDETKGWLGDSLHRMYRHHSEGIFEMQERFGTEFKNSDGKTVYTRYVGEQHVKEDCNNYIPSAKEAFAEVPQTPSVFHRSVRDNIMYGRPSATEDELAAEQAVAKATSVTGFIRRPAERNTFPDHLPRGLLARLLAYQLQVQLHGDLSKQSLAYLKSIEADLIAGRPAETLSIDQGRMVPDVWRTTPESST